MKVKTNVKAGGFKRGVAMKNKMGRIFVALAVVLLLRVPANAYFWDYGRVLCSLDEYSNIGYARIFPPGGYSDGQVMWWIGKVHHFDAWGNTWEEWTDWFYYLPGDGPLKLGAGWYAYSTSANQWVVYAYPYGSIILSSYLYDSSSGGWPHNGQSDAGCYVNNDPANDYDFWGRRDSR